MAHRPDLTGQRFARLLVLRRDGFKGPRKAWLCLCDCGNEHRVTTSDLLNGKVQSCGCLRRDRKSTFKHGHAASRSPSYQSWTAMNKRCRDSKHRFYHRYGGRGITICERWESFENFLADMGERPAGTSLDRIDCDGHYTPENCRWSTHKEQTRNRSQPKITEEIVADIRARQDEKLRVLAEEYGVSEGHICMIRHGKTWS
jgi:hypothetical protein